MSDSSNRHYTVVFADVCRSTFLFNELGIQIGNAQVEARNATTNIDRMTLEPGEVRSYSDMIKMLRQGEPAYFLIHVEHRGQEEGEKTREYPDEVISP